MPVSCRVVTAYAYHQLAQLARLFKSTRIVAEVQYSLSRRMVVMTSATRTLWWGIGVVLLAVIALLVQTGTGLQASLSSSEAGQSVYFWLVYPTLVVIQNVAFPLGAALIAASFVIRHIANRPSPSVQQQSQRHTAEVAPKSSATPKSS